MGMAICAGAPFWGVERSTTPQEEWTHAVLTVQLLPPLSAEGIHRHEQGEAPPRCAGTQLIAPPDEARFDTPRRVGDDHTPRTGRGRGKEILLGDASRVLAPYVRSEHLEAPRPERADDAPSATGRLP